ncbi:MAG: glycoside hydrolase family 99-like domain-containing protein [Deltaproteobacteria bacterium]|nr:glycoside hydrolase family 99-like domain-containing protein [Candidatus Tharpella aukensis]
MEHSIIPYEAVENIGTGNVLVLAPHPDDEIFGCAGAIMRHMESKDSVRVIILSDGGYLESGSREEYIQMRKQESIQAGALLGYIPEFWDIPDRKVVYGEKLITRISETINVLAIDLVYAPSVSEMHPDHRSLGMAVAEAVRRSDKNISIAFYEIGIPLRPNRLLDISDLVMRKQEAMDCFPSQLNQQKYDRHIAALNCFRTYTLPTRIQAAEAYFIISGEELHADPLALYHLKLEKITFPGLDIEAHQGTMVTVIIRSIGRDKLLSEALASVALQTYPYIEVLVINAKGEGHPELDPWCGRFSLRICGIGEPLSRSRAANLGLENAKGDYLIFLDDDDLFNPDHVACLIEVLKNTPGALVAYAGIITTGGEGTCASSTFNLPYNSFQLLTGNYIPIHAVMFHRSLLNLGCRFDENMDIYEDWDFWLQLSQETKFIHVDRITAQYRIFDDYGSNVQIDDKMTRSAKLAIYEKWKNKWSEEQLLELMQAAYEKPSMEKEISAKEAAVEETVAKLKLCKATIDSLLNDLDEKEVTIVSLQNDLDEKEITIVSLQNDLDKKEVTITGLQSEIQDRENNINILLHSKSWRLTAVFRKGRRFFTTTLVTRLRKLTSDGARSLWSTVPVPIGRKLAIKRVLFTYLPILFKHTLAYQNWQGFTAHQAPSHQDINRSTVSLEHIVKNNPKRYVPLLDEAPYISRTIRLIAFYLPQFHQIPENDAWWGKGFTEWTNVKAAKPQFEGHYQPHVPGELGYYDLTNALETQRRQVELAELYGLEGFCFYFYWFDGKRLLEGPVQQYLENKELDFPFCLCWANENWCRRWDGLDDEILISQNHSPEDDLAFIEYTSRYFHDSRYIRVQGKPLLLVYRPGLLPSAKATANRWRQWCRNRGIGEIYLAYTQSFEVVNPEKYGFDAAIEFPPNLAGIPPLAACEKKLFHRDFTGTIYDLGEIAKRSNHYTHPDYTLFRSVCPSWDNTARRGEAATIFVNDSPVSYQQWLHNAAIDTAGRFKQKEASLVFVNAWNEWAEGAHLEPDQTNGYAYLQATRDAISQADAYLERRRILLVAHDAHPHGAQSLILHMAKMLHENFFFVVEMVVLGGGTLLDEYARYATVHSLTGKKHDGKEARDLAAALFSRGFHAAICNTTVTGIFAKSLKKQGFQVVSLIHELTRVIKDNNLQPQVQAIANYADHIVFPVRQVQEGFASYVKKPLSTAIIRPQGLYKKNSLSSLPAAETKKRLLEKLGLKQEAKIVLAIAFGDHRKGIDLFVEAGLLVARENENIYFVWVGQLDSAMEQTIQEKLSASNFSDHFIFPGMDFQTDLYYAGADLYALTSREDPFPSVVLEALDAATPVIAFTGTGGCGELLSRDTGSLIPAFDTHAYAEEIIKLLEQPKLLNAKGAKGREIIASEFSFRHYLFDLLNLVGSPVKRISVVVPNYNYARYLSERISSIVQQTYPLYEIIILDDASTDGSIELLEKILPTLEVDFTFIPGESNSGNPFIQWLKGIEQTQGDYIWIAEADDLSSPEFLEEVIKPFSDPQVVVSYCQSKQITSSGDIICNHYLDYVADISPAKWFDYYTVDGEEEVTSALSIKNTIPNVSAVVFEKKRLLQVLRENIAEITQYRVAGDWLTYLLVLQEGKISFSPESFNSHRRHQESITLGSFNIFQLKEILSVQKRARDTFHPDDELDKKAHTYSQQLYKDFGLANDAAPEFSNNPELDSYR